MLENRVYKILIVDDDIEFHKDTRSALRHHYLCDAAVDPQNVQQKILEKKYDLVLLDLVLNEGTEEKIGLRLLPDILEKQNSTPVVIITADGNVETVVEAMKKGAADYIHKEELNYDILDEKFRKIIENYEIKHENVKLKEEIKRLKKKETSNYPFIGNSPAIDRIKKTLEIVSGEPNVTILITGETGVGKEVAARYLHRHGARRDQPFQAVNLSAIQKTLLESELFGHIKGAFTGATRSKEGYFRQADGGVLMLDEIGDIDQNIQIKLLRFLETKLIRPVGSDNDFKLDIQIVAATHKDLKKEVAAGKFREDLFQRLKAKIIEIPPLRARKEDIPLIINHYLEQQSYTVEIISEEVMNYFLSYPWRGNVRELKYAIESVLLEMRILGKNQVDSECLPKEILEYPLHAKLELPENRPGLTPGVEQNISPEEQKALIDLHHIEKVLIQMNKVKGDAAKRLGYKSSDNLRYKIKTYFEKYPKLFENFPTIKHCYKRVVL